MSKSYAIRILASNRKLSLAGSAVTRLRLLGDSIEFSTVTRNQVELTDPLSCGAQLTAQDEHIFVEGIFRGKDGHGRPVFGQFAKVLPLKN